MLPCQCRLFFSCCLLFFPSLKQPASLLLLSRSAIQPACDPGGSKRQQALDSLLPHPQYCCKTPISCCHDEPGEILCKDQQRHVCVAITIILQIIIIILSFLIFNLTYCRIITSIV